MHIYAEKSESQRNIEAVKRAMDQKISEVQAAERKLADLRAELRGLSIALAALEGKPTPRDFETAATS